MNIAIDTLVYNRINPDFPSGFDQRTAREAQESLTSVGLKNPTKQFKVATFLNR